MKRVKVKSSVSKESINKLIASGYIVEQEIYEVLILPKYVVVNSLDKRVHSSWKTLEEAKNAAKDLNTIVKPLLGKHYDKVA